MAFTFRPYQKKTIKAIIAKTKVSNKVVLAAAPAAGKTNMSFEILRQLLLEGKRALVLAHGTNVLKDNYLDQFEKYCVKVGSKPFNIGDTDEFNNKDYNVIVGIPQTVVHLNIKKDDFDILLVDEAHEFYFAEHLIPKIKKKCSVDLEVLMTGTPEDFNLRNQESKKQVKPYDVYYLAANDIPEKYLNVDTTIEVASTSINATEEDYTYNQLHREKQKEFFNNFTDKSEEVLDEIYARLRSRMRANPKKYYTTVKIIEKLKKNWSSIFPFLGKTIIYCNTIEQANIVNKYFVGKLGSESVSLSHYKNDGDSKQIKEFKEQPNKLILIVLRRARLGFDLDILTTVIDFSFSRNISDIYQMYARALRISDKPLEKIYIKICPNNNVPYFRDVVMAGALSLMERKYLESYNGKNFYSSKIPYLRKVVKAKTAKGVKRNAKAKIGQKQRIEYHPLDIPTIRSYREIFHKDGSLIQGVVYLSVDDVRKEFLTDRIVFKERLEKIKKLKERPSKKGTDKELKSLGHFLYRAIRFNDREVLDWVEIHRPEWLLEDAFEKSFDKLKSLTKLPSKSKDVKIYSFYSSKKKYKTEKDKIVIDWVKENRPDWEYKPNGEFEKLFKEVKKLKVRPLRSSSDDNEVKLSFWLKDRLKGKGKLDKRVVSWVETKRPLWLLKNRTALKVSELKKLTNRPRTNSKVATEEELRLGMFLSEIKKKRNEIKFSETLRWLKKNRPNWF